MNGLLESIWEDEKAISCRGESADRERKSSPIGSARPGTKRFWTDVKYRTTAHHRLGRSTAKLKYPVIYRYQSSTAFGRSVN